MHQTLSCGTHKKNHTIYILGCCVWDVVKESHPKILIRGPLWVVIRSKSHKELSSVQRVGCWSTLHLVETPPTPQTTVVVWCETSTRCMLLCPWLQWCGVCTIMPQNDRKSRRNWKILVVYHPPMVLQDVPTLHGTQETPPHHEDCGAEEPHHQEDLTHVGASRRVLLPR